MDAQIESQFWYSLQEIDVLLYGWVYYFTCACLGISKAIAPSFYIIKWCEMLCALCDWQFWRFSALCSCKSSLSLSISLSLSRTILVYYVLPYKYDIHLFIGTDACSFSSTALAFTKATVMVTKDDNDEDDDKPHKRLVHYTNQQYAFYQIK